MHAPGDSESPATSSVDVAGANAANDLARLLHAPLIKSTFRSDYVDVSLSPGNRKRFGVATRGATAEQKQGLIEQVYRPYRQRVQSAIDQILQQFTFAIHLSVRSFSPRHRGRQQRTDIGLLYDPSRTDEMNLCIDWIDELYFTYPDLRVRRNYPRRGTVDCLTKSMRTIYPADQYIGIEVWMNRAWVSRDVRLRHESIRQFGAALGRTIVLPIQAAA